MDVTLTASDFQLLQKALAFFATVCTDIEIRDSNICVKTNDKIVSYEMSLPLSQKLTISIADIAEFLKLLKDFKNYDVRITDNEYFYFFTFEKLNSVVTIRKPHVIVNPYNKEKVQALLDLVTLQPLLEDQDGSTINVIRNVAHRFKSDILVDLRRKKLSLISSTKNVKFDKQLDLSDIPISDEVSGKFKILQRALPSLPFEGYVAIKVSEFTLPNQDSPKIFYTIEGSIELEKSLVPCTIYGVSDYVDDLLEEV